MNYQQGLDKCPGFDCGCNPRDEDREDEAEDIRAEQEEINNLFDKGEW